MLIHNFQLFLKLFFKKNSLESDILYIPLGSKSKYMFKPEEKIAMQRAAVMGLLTCLLNEKQELTLAEVKEKIMMTLDAILEFEATVGDFIDAVTFEAAKECAEMDWAVVVATKLTKGEA